MLQDSIQQVKAGQSLSPEQMADMVDLMMQGKTGPAETAELLTALHEKGESVDELVGAATAMRSHMKTIRCKHERAVDTCGTGGSGKGTFNISTAAAFVAAACGTVIAKHGNRKATSHSGSTDVLAELGVAVDQDIESAERCLNEARICFCHAPLFHPSVKHVVPIRRSLPHPTIFNLLGPLCNPALAPHQVLGAGRGETQQLIASALQKLGTRRSVVVHGNDGLGEISCSVSTRVFDVDGKGIEEKNWGPGDFGLEPTCDDLQADSPAASARMIRRILDGEKGSQRDIVVMNAAAAVWISGNAETLQSAAEKCGNAIDSGKAREKLLELQQLTNA